MYSKLFEFILNIVISTSRQVESSMSQKIWSYTHIHTAYISAGLIILSGIISQRPNSSNYSLLHNYVNRPPHILVFMAYPKIFFFLLARTHTDLSSSTQSANEVIPSVCFKGLTFFRAGKTKIKQTIFDLIKSNLTFAKQRGS